MEIMGRRATILAIAVIYLSKRQDIELFNRSTSNNLVLQVAPPLQEPCLSV